MRACVLLIQRHQISCCCCSCCGCFLNAFLLVVAKNGTSSPLWLCCNPAVVLFAALCCVHQAYRAGTSTRPVAMASKVRANGSKMATTPMMARGSCVMGGEVWWEMVEGSHNSVCPHPRCIPKRHCPHPSQCWSASILLAHLRGAVTSSRRLCMEVSVACVKYSTVSVR